MGRPPLGKEPMTSAERKRLQAEREKAGRATMAAVDRTLLRVFKSRLRDVCQQTPDNRDSTAVAIACDVVRNFPVAERGKAARLLGFEPPVADEDEQLDL
jgi:hypothetical protein